MQADFERNFPSTDVEILGVNEFGQESGNSIVASETHLPLLQDVDANSNGKSDVWHDSWQVVWRDVIVLDGDNINRGVYNLTTHDLANAANYETLRTMIRDVITADRTAATPWQNRTEPLDVNGDHFVAAIDALVGINEINSHGSYRLPTPDGPISAFYDVNGDQFISSIDVLNIINHLNRISRLQQAPASAMANSTSSEAAPQLFPTASTAAAWDASLRDSSSGVGDSLAPASSAIDASRGSERSVGASGSHPAADLASVSQAVVARAVLSLTSPLGDDDAGDDLMSADSVDEIFKVSLPGLGI